MSKYCGCIKKECDRLIFATATFTAPNYIINLPAGSYGNNERYCIVVTAAPAGDVTAGAPVFFTIGSGTELYPFIDCTGRQVTERSIATRYRYSVCVRTTPTTGSFKLMGRACVVRQNNDRLALDGTAPAAAAAGGDGA